MSSKANALADKLQAEGARTLAFFRQLPAATWQRQLYAAGAGWAVRDTFEHLIVSEEWLLQLFEKVVRTGVGADDAFSVDDFNAEHTGELTGLAWDDLQSRYLAARQRSVQFVQALEDQQLALRARHPALGETTLEEMIKLIYVHHSLHMRDVKRMQQAPSQA